MKSGRLIEETKSERRGFQYQVRFWKRLQLVALDFKKSDGLDASEDRNKALEPIRNLNLHSRIVAKDQGFGQLQCAGPRHWSFVRV